MDGKALDEKTLEEVTGGLNLNDSMKYAEFLNKFTLSNCYGCALSSKGCPYHGDLHAPYEALKGDAKKSCPSFVKK